MKLRKRIIIIGVLLGLAACASSGVKIDQSKVEKLEKGKTNYAEVMQAFGKPTSNTLMSDGTRMVAYYYFSFQSHPENFIPIVGPLVSGADSEHTMVMLTFDHDGILKSYSASEGGSGSGRNLESVSQTRKDVRAVE